MRLLGSTKRKITEDENCENALYLEINEVVLIPSNSYKQDSRVLYTFVPNKLFRQ